MLQEEGLTLPHPGLLEREFVLAPLAELLPDWCYPVPGAHRGLSVRELVERVKERHPERSEGSHEPTSKDPSLRSG